MNNNKMDSDLVTIPAISCDFCGTLTVLDEHAHHTDCCSDCGTIGYVIDVNINEINHIQ